MTCVNVYGVKLGYYQRRFYSLEEANATTDVICSNVSTIDREKILTTIIDTLIEGCGRSIPVNVMDSLCFDLSFSLPHPTHRVTVTTLPLCI